MDFDRLLRGRPFPHLAVRLAQAMAAEDLLRLSPRHATVVCPWGEGTLEQETTHLLPTRAVRAALARPPTCEAWIATLEGGATPLHPAPPPDYASDGAGSVPETRALAHPFADLRADAAGILRALVRVPAAHLLLRRDAGLALSADGRLGGWGLPSHGAALAIHPVLSARAVRAETVLLDDLHAFLPDGPHPLPATAHARLAWGLPEAIRAPLAALLGAPDLDHLALRAGPALALALVRTYPDGRRRLLVSRIVADAR